jgi:hypothetical protein
MTDSNTRKRLRVKLQAFVLDNAKLAQEGEPPDVDGWLDDLMQTPELSLAELAESNPDYRLAVVEVSPVADIYAGDTQLFRRALSRDEIERVFWATRGYRRVVKMEQG